MAYLSTAPSGECHLMLPCVSLSRLSHSTVDRGSPPSHTVPPLSRTGERSLPPLPEMHLHTIPAFPLNMNNLNNKCPLSERILAEKVMCDLVFVTSICDLVPV